MHCLIQKMCKNICDAAGKKMCHKKVVCGRGSRCYRVSLLHMSGGGRGGVFIHIHSIKWCGYRYITFFILTLPFEPYLLPYLILRLTIPYILPYLTLHLTSPYLKSYLTTLPYVLPYILHYLMSYLTLHLMLSYVSPYHTLPYLTNLTSH